jgi:hypothetical protein
MIRTLNAILMLTSVAALVFVYSLKYTGEDTAKAKTALEHQIARQEGDLSLLQADWASLNQPGHIAPIVARHQDALGLAGTAQEQFGSMDGLPMRPPAPDEAALDNLIESLESGVDPIQQIIESN